MSPIVTVPPEGPTDQRRRKAGIWAAAARILCGPALVAGIGAGIVHVVMRGARETSGPMAALISVGLELGTFFASVCMVPAVVLAVAGSGGLARDGVALRRTWGLLLLGVLGMVVAWFVVLSHMRSD